MRDLFLNGDKISKENEDQSSTRCFMILDRFDVHYAWKKDALAKCKYLVNILSEANRKTAEGRSLSSRVVPPTL